MQEADPIVQDHGEVPKVEDQVLLQEPKNVNQVKDNNALSSKVVHKNVNVDSLEVMHDEAFIE